VLAWHWSLASILSKSPASPVWCYPLIFKRSGQHSHRRNFCEGTHFHPFTFPSLHQTWRRLAHECLSFIVSPSSIYQLYSVLLFSALASRLTSSSMAATYDVGTRAWQPDAAEGWVASELISKTAAGPKTKLVFQLENGEVYTQLIQH
jgi:hypothetical protein